MWCPVCAEVQLVMTERQGIEIDYCPQCRGVWLDRGELDKIIERAAPDVEPDRHQHDRSRRDYPVHEGGYRTKKKRGLLGELFDFD